MTELYPAVSKKTDRLENKCYLISSYSSSSFFRWRGEEGGYIGCVTVEWQTDALIEQGRLVPINSRTRANHTANLLSPVAFYYPGSDSGILDTKPVPPMQRTAPEFNGTRHSSAHSNGAFFNATRRGHERWHTTSVS